MRRIMAGAAGAVLAVSLLAGCTGDDESPESDGGPETSEEGARLETTAAVGQVAGKLGNARRQRVLSDVTGAVDKWLDAAYVEGDYPRSDFGDAFPGFTKGAAALAAKQPRVLSNAAVGDRLEQVDVLKRNVTVDVLSPGGKPAGATARIVLDVGLSGEIQRTDRIQGRVMLTPTKGGWQVFAFDVQRNIVERGQ